MIRIDKKYAWDVLQHISDPYSIRILRATLHRALDAITLSNQLGIPIAVCYRRIRELEKLGLLQKEGRRLTSKGKWVNLYKASIKDAEVKMIDGKIVMKITFRYGREEEIEVE
ncbi:MAG: helix-turn-helix transcriptional regulator [Euryarchaeota archaeon]|nr:helix-turn-helix transcriptional regulator [Euryarchaeota archaeon]